MSEQQIVTAAQARITALEQRVALAESLVIEANERAMRAEEDKHRAEALLAHYRSSLAERHNDPMQDGSQATQEAIREA